MKAYQLKIAIKDSHPPIWRRVVVPAGMSFSQLIKVFQISMGWLGGHLSMFEFQTLGIQIEEEPGEQLGWGDYEVLDASETLIDQFLDEMCRFTYIYDFGDDWRHHVTVEEILTDYSLDYPIVVKYKGDIPYEDCGGIYGYYHLLEVLDNPEHPEYEDMREWAGDPAAVRYNMDSANEELQQYTPDSVIYDSTREPATLEEWGELYRIATEIKECELWDRFGPMDMIALAEDENNIVFVNIQGGGGTNCSITVYEGYKGLNDFMLMCLADDVGVSQEYAVFSRSAMCCFWGDREDLSREQWETVRSLGYRYRGKNQWLHFLAYERGFFPSNLCRDEVRDMITHLTRLKEAAFYYEREGMEVCFRDGNLFLYYLDLRTGTWVGREQRLPFMGYQNARLIIQQEDAESRFRQLEKVDSCWEIDMVYLGMAVSDEKYLRPINPRICIVADEATGLALDVQMLGPDDEEGPVMVDLLVDLFFQFGRPRQIHVSNAIVKGYMADLCRVGNIRLKRVRSLKSVTQLIDGFYEMQRGK